MQPTVFCRQCKQPIEPTDPFCKQCGAAQRPVSQQPASNPVNPATTPVTDTCPKCGGMLAGGVCAWCAMQLSAPAHQPEKRSVGALAGIVVVAAVCIVMLVMARQNGQGPAQKKATSTPPSQSPGAARGASLPQPPATYAYNPPQQQSSPTNQQPAVAQDTSGLDRMVGDYNSYLRRLDDSAAKQDAYIRTELSGSDEGMDASNKRVQEFYRFTADAGAALQMYDQIAASPLFAQNYRESTMLSASAQSRLGIPDAQSVSRAANLRYIEKR